MKKKYVYVLILLIICIYLSMIGKSFSQEIPDVSSNNINLIIKDNENIKESIIEHIDLIDDTIIPLASFEQSKILSNNYEFLVNFAIKFILDNYEYFNDKIVTMEDYVYQDEYNVYRTNQYVNKSVIYEITKNVFNKSDYLILNENLIINNDMVPLLLIDNSNFSMLIEKVLDFNINNDTYEVKVKYQNLDIIYKYIYTKTIDNTIVLHNLEIEMINS